ncbi:acyl-CoA thioesterase, partial [Amycolatopsis sp. NPDC058986]|uniref:acyl-CoA thioesterase n=1 Tax=Amycolatopsis sp. NPDC058986 TaxID=3346685 RepID=UPI00366FE64E
HLQSPGQVTPAPGWGVGPGGGPAGGPGGPPREGLTELPKGIVVVKLEVHYKAPIVVSDQDVLVDMTLTELRAASFTVDYRVHNGPSETDPVAVTASTLLAPYDTIALRPRRLNADESDFLKRVFTDA